MNKLLLLATACCTLAATTLVAQDASNDNGGASKGIAPKPTPTPAGEPVRTMSVGLMGGYSMDIHSLDQAVLPDVPSCCSGYDGATGGGFVFAALADFRLSDGLDLIARLGYHTSSVELTAEEPITVRVENEAKTAVITHQNTSTFGIVLVEPGIEYRLGQSFGLIGGLRLGILTTATYSQKEILDPTIPYDYQIAETGVRNESSGDISQTNSTQFGMFIGARYHLGLNARKTIELVPEIQFAPLFTSVITTDTWSIMSLRFMIGLSYSFYEVEDANPLAPR